MHYRNALEVAARRGLTVGERGVVGSRMVEVDRASGGKGEGGRDPRLAGNQAPPEDKSRIGVINDCGVINCGLH